MKVDSELLELLRCPADIATLELVPLPQAVCERLAERYRPELRDLEPEVSHGLACSECSRVYPIVAEIPVMLLDDALDRSELAEA